MTPSSELIAWLERDDPAEDDGWEPPARANTGAWGRADASEAIVGPVNGQLHNQATSSDQELSRRS